MNRIIMLSLIALSSGFAIAMEQSQIKTPALAQEVTALIEASFDTKFAELHELLHSTQKAQVEQEQRIQVLEINARELREQLRDRLARVKKDLEQRVTTLEAQLPRITTLENRIDQASELITAAENLNRERVARIIESMTRLSNRVSQFHKGHVEDPFFFSLSDLKR